MSESGAGGDGEELSEGEREELVELRRRVTALESAVPHRAGPRHWPRTLGSTVLVLIASVLAMLSVLSVWMYGIVGDTDRYVETVAPLASNHDIQEAVTNRVTGAVLAQIDVKSLVKQLSDAASQQGVPPRASALINDLSGPITSGLTELVKSTVTKVVSSSAFETVWVDANRRVHTALVKALTGKGGSTVSLKNNQVTIDLGPIVEQVKDALVKAGFAPAAKIPTVHTDFVVFASKDIGKIKTYFRLLQVLGVWLPVVTLLVAAAGVFLAVDRRRGLIGAALGIAAAMLLLAVALTAFRAVYLDRLPPGASEDAAAAVYDTLVRFLRAGVLALGTLALVTAIGAFLVGPSRVAVATRKVFRTGIGALRDTAVSAGMKLGPVGPFVHRYKRWIGGAVLLGAVIVLFTWSYPTAPVVVWTLAVVLACLAVREFLDIPRDNGGRRPPPSGADGAAAGGG
ncbi:hypothetical protein [Wenjunlia tyrosinilytica]|uniref:Integral membrane protein n=1 Tax=Wenjunlia tyrosinilytica TaxID=1544741 RepID=A0A917ZLP0_9ACTN|nr:hypothetical protein [Wenjunlia tyrosinilytica]GGO84305.1 hypothetical protein GCM10012280_15480 [Wenjunlia tyrosinilytica]